MDIEFLKSFLNQFKTSINKKIYLETNGLLFEELSQIIDLIDVGVLNEKTNKKGEQIVKIIIQIPSEISANERQLYEKLRDLNMNKKNAKSIYN